LHLEQLLLLQAKQGRLEHGKVLHCLGIGVWISRADAGSSGGDAGGQLGDGDSDVLELLSDCIGIL
jgi:hypothetical protein